MMGLLGNVAEVKTLRHRLMTSEFIQVFTDLLESSSDGIEVKKEQQEKISLLFFSLMTK